MIIVLLVLAAVAFYLMRQKLISNLSITTLLYEAEIKRIMAENAENNKVTEDKIIEAAEAKFNGWKLQEEKRIRKDSVKRSQEVLKGKVTEHIIPYFDSFPYDPRDCRFLGSPIDFIVFDGLSLDDVKRVVFLEVKTGNSAMLSSREKKVRDAIKQAKVEWQVIFKKNGGA